MGLGIPRSSVEKYRAGQIKELPYDLSDPIDRAICVALQVYVDYLERIDSEDKDGDDTIYEGVGPLRLVDRSAELLERYMCSLRDDQSEERRLSSDERYRRARDILRCLFGSALGMDGIALSMESGDYRVGRNFWDAGRDALEELEEVVQERREEAWPTLLTLVGQEAPTQFPESMAPLIALVQQALGSLVSQSEAARRLGLTPRGVALRIARGDLRQVEVEGRVLIPEEDLQSTEAEATELGSRAAEEKT